MRNNKDLKDLKEGLRRLDEIFGDRLGLLFHQLVQLAMSGQPCDITTYSGNRYLDVEVDSNFINAMNYGVGPRKLAEMLDKIKLHRTGHPTAKVSIQDIWTINPMPIGGFSQDQLDKVDMSKGEEKWGPQGETLREMMRNEYHCKDENEVDHFLRRFLAS